MLHRILKFLIIFKKKFTGLLCTLQIMSPVLNILYYVPDIILGSGKEESVRIPTLKKLIVCTLETEKKTNSKSSRPSLHVSVK